MASKLDPVSTIEGSDGDIPGAIKGGIAGLFTVVFSGIALGVDAVFQVFVNPTVALANELAALVSAYIPADIISAGSSVTQGALAQFGIFAYPIAMIVMSAGLYVLAQLLEREFSSNLIPFSLTDFPLIGTEEEEE